MDRLIHKAHLCGGGTNCCPDAEFFEHDAVVLSDEGDRVRLTREELQLLVDAARSGAKWDIR